MNKFAISIFLVTLASSSAFAQGKTRAEVYQELVEAQSNGMRYITDSSYPDINPVYAKMVEQSQQQYLAQQNAAKVTSSPDSRGVGGVASGSSETGRPAISNAEWNEMYGHP